MKSRLVLVSSITLLSLHDKILVRISPIWPDRTECIGRVAAICREYSLLVFVKEKFDCVEFQIQPVEGINNWVIAYLLIKELIPSASTYDILTRCIPLPSC